MVNLKETREAALDAYGLTTAAGVWMTAAGSAAAGLGQITVAFIATVFGLIVLTVFRRLEKEFVHHARADRDDHPPPPVSPGKQEDS